MQTLIVPDLGDFHDLPVIEVLIQAGDVVYLEQSLMTVESDKATMDVPSAFAGVVREVLLKPGDRVSRGCAIAHLEPVTAVAGEVARADEPAGEPPAVVTTQEQGAGSHADAGPIGLEPDAPTWPAPGLRTDAERVSDVLTLAGPAVRKLARELGVALSAVMPSGPKGRVLRQDVLAHVKAALTARPTPAAEGGLDLAPWPEVDFARFGPVERASLTRIQRLSGANLHRNWVRIPHVTNFEECDITELDALRGVLNRQRQPQAPRVTLLAFAIKACAHALRQFPAFNVSLDGEEVVRKQYVHIGFAADTPNGLVVPVIRDADRKGVAALAEEVAALAALAHEGRLSVEQMQGGCLSISSLGGIGGTHFTPIINAPEVAILGLGHARTQPVWDGALFQPRSILPLSLSWDHRAVDGAQAARFLGHIGAVLTDFRRAIL